MTLLAAEDRATGQVPRTHAEDPWGVRRKVEEQLGTEVKLPLNELMRTETRRTVRAQRAEKQQERRP